MPKIFHVPLIMSNAAALIKFSAILETEIFSLFLFKLRNKD